MDMKLSNWDLSYNNLYMHKKQYIYEKYDTLKERDAA